MDRELFVICTATLISTLHEVGDAPSGIVYAALMSCHKDMTLDQYTTLLDTLEASGLIMRRSDLLSLTERGDELAMRIAKVLPKGSAS